MEESVFSQSPFSNESSPSSSSSGSSSRRGKKLLFLIILLIILGLIAFGAVKFLGGSVLNAEPTPTPTISEPTPTEEPTPTPEEISGTPTPSPKASPTSAATPTKAASDDTVDKTSGIDRADITVAVQNGSGVSGAAKKMGDYMSGLGYALGTVGNADASDYAQTEIHVKAGKASLLTLLKKDVGAEYTVGTAASDYTGAGDALIIVGKE